uniref:Extracellular globin n=1 Tax=Galathealinum brachiosum TaxID=53701 RepID=A0A0S2MLM1_9ANNE|nr:hemoglobin subunit A2 [Galathealinum brachiosum]
MNSMFVLFAMAAFVAAARGCSPLDRILVKAEWAMASDGGHKDSELGSSIFRALVNIDPALRGTFSAVGGEDMGSAQFRAFAFRVVAGIERLIAVLDVDAVLSADLAVLHSQHVARDVSAANYESMLSAIMSVVPSAVGNSCFSSPSWSRCLNVIAAAM